MESRSLKRRKSNEFTTRNAKMTRKPKITIKKDNNEETSSQSKFKFSYKDEKVREENLVCPCCQVSLKLIAGSRQLHVNDCLEVDRSQLSECPLGSECCSNVVDHYASYNHCEVQKPHTQNVVNANVAVSCPQEDELSKKHDITDCIEASKSSLTSPLKDRSLLLRQMDIRKFFGGAKEEICHSEKSTKCSDMKQETQKVNQRWQKANINTATKSTPKTTSFSQLIGKVTLEDDVNKRRKCPFYKIIKGSSFAVDAFSYGTIPGIEAYFLSHFHYDHYQGLGKKFKHPIYCSKVTSNLVKLQLGVDDCFLHSLPLNESCTVHGIEVILIEANHCPGAVMFCFRFPNNRIVVHTGDFRADRTMETIPCLSMFKIDTVYLDTTYCDEMYDFPSQELAVNAVVRIARDALKENEKTLFVCGTYTIGKEKIFLALAKAIGSKICAYFQKRRILGCLEDDELSDMITSNWKEAQVHVLPMNKLTFMPLKEHLDGHSDRYTRLVAIKPTGWEYKKGSSLEHLCPKSAGPIKIYGIPYSEHSSYSELKQFIQFLKPRNILPTVNNGNAKSRVAMENLFKQWLR